MAACVLAASFLGLVACSSPESSAEAGQAGENLNGRQDAITVFAASSLATAFQEISEAYESNYPGNRVILNFDGSQRLRTQLEHGAAADVFASADWAQMDALQEKGLLAGNPTTFASNRLVLLLAAEVGNPAEGSALQDPKTQGMVGGFARQLSLLSQPGRKIVLGQPQVPIGRYSEALMEQIAEDPSLGPDLVENLFANVVSRESSVRGVAQKVALGEADGGITYATDALTEYTSRGVRVVELPDSLSVQATYPVAPLARTVSANRFIEFLLSEKGQHILGNHGFGPPSGIRSGDPDIR
ncbi:MAG: molybdate ABC transporter substrate-binding protein [Chloroflexota bacterium]|nr:molybdate ABC transporter substrate-binding protein [Chloroflexota bacterium]